MKIFKTNSGFLPILFTFFSLFYSCGVSANIQTEAKTYFDQGVSLLNESNKAQEDSRRIIIEANSIRKKIKKVRLEIRKTKDQGQQEKLIKEADKLTAQLRKSQDKGGDLRAQSKDVLQNALNAFEDGIVKKWGGEIQSRIPLAADDGTMMFMAHNTRFRSVHPNMLNKMGTPTENMDPERVNEEMSIRVPSLSGQNAPPDLDISSFQLSREQKIIAHIEVKDEKGIEKSTEGSSLVPLHKIHKWRLMLSDLAGNPIENAKIEIVGHMPGHVHGLPTQPRVTKEISPGIYQVEGVKFQMKGWWVMQFNINDKKPNNTDSVVFNLVL